MEHTEEPLGGDLGDRLAWIWLGQANALGRKGNLEFGTATSL